MLKSVKKKSTDLLRHLTGSENFTENRKGARLNIPIGVEYLIENKSANHSNSNESRKKGVTKNISHGGCLISLSEKIELDSILHLTIRLQDSDNLKVRGRIIRLVRSDGELYEYAISFDSLDKENKWKFANFCFRKMYEMIGLKDWPTKRKE